jgi:murein DD-endopeptidase MepM/ murein hydrolase activator NlpD
MLQAGLAAVVGLFFGLSPYRLIGRTEQTTVAFVPEQTERETPIQESANSITEQAPAQALIQETAPPPMEFAESAPVVSDPMPEAQIETPRATSKQIIHVVAAGDTLTKIWKTHGATVAGALAASSALKELDSGLPGLRGGEKLELTLSETGDISQMKRRLKDGRVLILEGSASGYRARFEGGAFEEKERVASGTIRSSFAAAASSNDVPYEVVDQLVDLFGGRVEFRKDLRQGDSFSVIYQERRDSEGELVALGHVQAASLKIDGKLLVAVRHQSKNGQVMYFDESGEPLGNYFLRYPVQFTRISSVFTNARLHPVLQRNRPHNGVDFAAPVGTPVRSVADGVVTQVGYFGGGGNTIKIQHDDRYSTAYLHLSRFAKGLKKGSRISRGQVIGAVGATGLATGPHLHFSLYDRGKYVNPMNAQLPKMPNNGERVSAAYLQTTLQTLKKQHEEVRMAALLSEGQHG